MPVPVGMVCSRDTLTLTLTLDGGQVSMIFSSHLLPHSPQGTCSLEVGWGRGRSLSWDQMETHPLKETRASDLAQGGLWGRSSAATCGWGEAGENPSSQGVLRS